MKMDLVAALAVILLARLISSISFVRPSNFSKSARSDET